MTPALLRSARRCFPLHGDLASSPEGDRLTMTRQRLRVGCREQLSDSRSSVSQTDAIEIKRLQSPNSAKATDVTTHTPPTHCLAVDTCVNSGGER
jgi:hypothetical protein